MRHCLTWYNVLNSNPPRETISKVRTPQSVTLNRELLLAFHEAQLEAAAAIGMRGETAIKAMRRERRRMRDKRWNDAVRMARHTEIKRVSEDDYRSLLPEDQGGPEAIEGSPIILDDTRGSTDGSAVHADETTQPREAVSEEWAEEAGDDGASGQ